MFWILCIMSSCTYRTKKTFILFNCFFYICSISLDCCILFSLLDLISPYCILSSSFFMYFFSYFFSSFLLTVVLFGPKYSAFWGVSLLGRENQVLLLIHKECMQTRIFKCDTEILSTYPRWFLMKSLKKRTLSLPCLDSPFLPKEKEKK